MNILTCPVCKERLKQSEKSYVCSNKHSFDIAKSGYINLLLSSGANKIIHGDNKLMVNARRDFLERGYYEPLLNGLKKVVSELYNDGDIILDAGCGEGYYTNGMYECLSVNNDKVNIYGVDVSKIAVDIAAKKCKEVKYVVASVFHMPIADESCDIVTTLFAPFCKEEFYRVLRKTGVLVMVIPSERHLYGLKIAIYDKPYLNNVKDYHIDDFELIKNEKISYTIHIDNNSDIQNLFSMTPYYYKSGKKEQDKIAELNELDTEIEFEILVYRKVL